MPEPSDSLGPVAAALQRPYEQEPELGPVAKALQQSDLGVLIPSETPGAPGLSLEHHLGRRLKQERTWDTVAPELKAAGLDPEEYRQDYQLNEARAVQKGEGVGTMEQLGRQGLPVASSIIRQKLAQRYTDALDRFKERKASGEDIATIARYERLQQIDADMGKSFGGKLVQALGGGGEMVGEAAIAGPLAGRVGGLAGRAVGITAPAATRAGQVARFAGRQAVATPLMPSLYQPHFAGKNIAEGQSADDLKSAPAALGLAYANNLVLGQLQGIARNASGSLVKRSLGAGAIGTAESSGVEVVAGITDEFLPKAYKTDTRYGTLGMMARGEHGQAMQHAAVSTLTFAVFAGLHGKDPQPMIDAAGKVIDSTAKTGGGPATAAARLKPALDLIESSVKSNPEITRPEAEKLFEADKSEIGDYGRAWAKTLPDASAQQKLGASVAPKAEPTAPAEVAPEQPKTPLESLDDAGIKEIQQFFGVKSKKALFELYARDPLKRKAIDGLITTDKAPPAPEKPAEPVSPESSPKSPETALPPPEAKPEAPAESPSAVRRRESMERMKAASEAKPAADSTLADLVDAAGLGERRNPSSNEVIHTLDYPGADGQHLDLTIQHLPESNAIHLSFQHKGKIGGLKEQAAALPKRNAIELLRDLTKIAKAAGERGLAIEFKAEPKRADLYARGLGLAGYVRTKRVAGKEDLNEYRYERPGSPEKLGANVAPSAPASRMEQLRQRAAAQGDVLAKGQTLGPPRPAVNLLRSAALQKAAKEAVSNAPEVPAQAAAAPIKQPKKSLADTSAEVAKRVFRNRTMTGRAIFDRAVAEPTAENVASARDALERLKMMAERQGLDPEAFVAKEFPNAPKAEAFELHPQEVARVQAEAKRAGLSTEAAAALIEKADREARNNVQGEGNPDADQVLGRGAGNAGGTEAGPEGVQPGGALAHTVEEPTRPPPLSEAERRDMGTGGGSGLPGAERVPEPMRDTALANARVDKERIEQKLPPLLSEARKANEAVWDAAMLKIDADPRLPGRLVDELAENPRATTVEENALLLHQRIALSNEHRRAMANAIRLFKDGDRAEFDRAAAKEADLLARIDRLDGVTRQAGTEWGRAGQFRRQLVREDYSLSSMLMRAELAKGKPLTIEEKVEVVKQQEAIEAADKELDAAETGKKPPAPDGKPGDLADLRIKVKRTKSAFASTVDNMRVANLPPGKRLLGAIGESFNAMRSIITAFDLSAVFRQGGFFTFGRPIAAAKAFPDMLRSWGSEHGFDRAQDAIDQRPNRELYDQAKLYLADRSTPLGKQEEAFVGRWTQKIPGVAASERAYTAFLNRIRADAFDAITGGLSVNGKPTIEEARAVAHFINVATGRGSLGKLEVAATPLANLFFSPRYAVSRFQLLAGQPFAGGTNRVRLAVAKEYGRALLGLGAFYALAAAANSDEKITFDPRSSDFGKVRFGKTRLDPLAGLAQTATFVARLTSGETKKSNGGIVPIRGAGIPYAGDTVLDVVTRFIRGKLAPVPGAMTDVAVGKTTVGEPTTARGVAGRLAIPMAISDVYEAMVDQGAPRGVAISLLAILGMGAQTYEPKPKK